MTPVQYVPSRPRDRSEAVADQRRAITLDGMAFFDLCRAACFDRLAMLDLRDRKKFSSLTYPTKLLEGQFGEKRVLQKDSRSFRLSAVSVPSPAGLHRPRLAGPMGTRTDSASHGVFRPFLCVLHISQHDRQIGRRALRRRRIRPG